MTDYQEPTVTYREGTSTAESFRHNPHDQITNILESAQRLLVTWLKEGQIPETDARYINWNLDSCLKGLDMIKRSKS